MNKKKAVFVTILLAVLLAALDVCLFKIAFIGFAIVTGILALYGFYRCSIDFYGWLGKEPATSETSLELPVFSNEREFTYDDIIAEVRGKANEDC